MVALGDLSLSYMKLRFIFHLVAPQGKFSDPPRSKDDVTHLMNLQYIGDGASTGPGFEDRDIRLCMDNAYYSPKLPFACISIIQLKYQKTL